MKTFKKYAISALLSISMVAPLCAHVTEIKNGPAPAIQQVEISDSTDVATEIIESTETMENIEPAKVPWYKNPYVIIGSGLLAGSLLVTYVIHPLHVAREIALGDIRWNMKLDWNKARQKANDDLARYAEIAKDSADYNKYQAQRNQEFLTEIKAIYKKYGMSQPTVKEGKRLNDNTVNTYIF
jgi:hypothetical protein